MPIDMDRQTVGIVGYGSIGRELARLCAGMGMTVLASKQDLGNTAEVNAFVLPGVGDPYAEISPIVSIPRLPSPLWPERLRLSCGAGALDEQRTGHLIRRKYP